MGGIRHGEYLVLPKNQAMNESQKKELKKKIDQQKEIDETPVKGVFKNVECAGGDISFWYKKYDEPPRFFHMIDGKEYTIPKMVAEHLNKNTRENTYIYDKQVWEAGELPMISNTGKPKTKFMFVEGYGLAESERIA